MENTVGYGRRVYLQFQLPHLVPLFRYEILARFLQISKKRVR